LFFIAVRYASGATSYSWNTSATTNSIIVNPSSTTNYTVVGTTGTCTSQAVSTISITPSSTVSINGASTICSGDSIRLSAIGANNYLWNNSAITSSVVLNPNITTTYSVIGSVGSCTSMAVATVTVNPNPVPIITGNTAICQGQSTTLTVSGVNNFIWSTGSSANSIIVNPLTNTTYTIISTTGTCTNQAVITVSLTPNPTVSIIGDTIVCSGSQANLSANGANNYIWNTGNVTQNIHLNPIINTTYTVVGAIGTCTNQAVITVGVTPNPVVSVAGNTVICLGQSSTLTASGANNYLWNIGAITASIVVSPVINTTYTVIGTTGNCINSVTLAVLTSNVLLTGNNIICQGKNTTLIAHGSTNYLWSTGATTANVVLSPTITTTYTVVGTTGTCTTEVIDTVYVNSIPYVFIVGDTIICSGQSTKLTASGAGTYMWSTGAVTPSIVVTPKITTIYNIIGTTGTCTSQAIETVHVNPSPKAIYELNPNPITLLAPLVSFINQSTNYTHWVWNFGDDSENDSLNKNPTHFYSTEAGGSYQTSLTLTNQYGCKDEATVLLVVEPEFSFFIPNTFTPNADGRNEVFKGVGTGIENYEFWIFDRWGTCVFSTNDINNGWDGKLKNKTEIVQQGVYIWKVEIKDLLKTSHQFSGTVNLIK